MSTYGSYTEYLNSEEWQKRRIKILIRDQFQCQICGTGKQLRVHHIRYPEAYGEEPDSDLITVCDTCHKKIHENDIRAKEQERRAWEEYRKQVESKKRVINQIRSKWVNEVKFRDFLYGGSENMCSLAILKSSAEEFARENNCSKPAPSYLQWTFGYAHYVLVNEMYRRGYTTEEIYQMTPLDRSTIEKYLTKSRVRAENNWSGCIPIDEIKAVVNQYIEDR